MYRPSGKNTTSAASIAAWMAGVSSVSPSPTAPRFLTLAAPGVWKLGKSSGHWWRR